jgi:hypothetical protein
LYHYYYYNDYNYCNSNIAGWGNKKQEQKIIPIPIRKQQSTKGGIMDFAGRWRRKSPLVSSSSASFSNSFSLLLLPLLPPPSLSQGEGQQMRKASHPGFCRVSNFVWEAIKPFSKYH